MTQTCTCGRPVHGAFLCDRCVKALEIALGNISAYWCDLDTVKGRQTRYGSSAGGGRAAEKPLPIDGRFTDWDGQGSITQDAVKNTIATWVRVVLDERPVVPGPTCGKPCLHLSCALTQRSRPPQDNIPSCCRYLLGHVEWIRTAIYGPEMLDELDDCEAQLRRLVDRPAERWYAGPCDGCERDLYAKLGAPTVDCEDCDRVYDIEVRRKALLAEAEDRLASASDIARAVSWLGAEPLTPVRVWQWASRKRLAVKGHDKLPNGKTVPLYRIGDAIDLMASDTRPQAG